MNLQESPTSASHADASQDASTPTARDATPVATKECRVNPGAYCDWCNDGEPFFVEQRDFLLDNPTFWKAFDVVVIVACLYCMGHIALWALRGFPIR